jgi:hypothetical protein
MADENMLSAYGSLLDVAATENAAIRDNAFKTANLARGRGSVYLSSQAGGMLMSNLADMAGMKTIDEERQETIESILDANRNLDPNDPKTLYTIGQQFSDAGFTGIAQKFIERGRKLDMEQYKAVTERGKMQASLKTAATGGQVKEGTTRQVGAGDEFPDMLKTQIYTNGEWKDSIDPATNKPYMQRQFKPTALSSFAEKKEYILALAGQIDPATGLEYTQETLNEMVNVLLGAGGVNIDFGSKDSFDETVGTLLAEKQAKQIDLAEKGPAQIDKLNTVLRTLNQGTPNVGFFSTIKQAFDKAFAAFGSEEAMIAASDTEFLAALLGSDVFPYIQSLGIGARGLDTPAERIFLQRVMTGEITMEGAALEQLTRLRQKYVVRAIQEYNRRVTEEDANGNTYYTRWEKSSGNKLQEMVIPKMLRPNKKEYTVPVFDADGNDTGKTMPEVFPRVEPIMEPVLGEDGEPTGKMKDSGKRVYTYRPNGPKYDEQGIDISDQYPNDIVTYVEAD